MRTFAHSSGLLAVTLAVVTLTRDAEQRPAVEGVRDPPAPTEAAPVPLPPPPSAQACGSAPQSFPRGRCLVPPGMHYTRRRRRAATGRNSVIRTTRRTSACWPKPWSSPEPETCHCSCRSSTRCAPLSGRAGTRDGAGAGPRARHVCDRRDLIDLKTFDPALDGTFRTELTELLTAETDNGPKTLVECHENRPNNWGTHCGASAAVAAYLGDTATLRAWRRSSRAGSAIDVVRRVRKRRSVMAMRSRRASRDQPEGLRKERPFARRGVARRPASRWPVCLAANAGRTTYTRPCRAR